MALVRAALFPALVGLAGVALLGCKIERVSQGSEILADPHEWIINGETTKAEVLRVFGPPDQIQRQLDGDIFTYSNMRRYSRELALKAPRTDFGVTYRRSDEKRDRLVVLFDKNSVVSGFGYRRGTEEMPTGFAGLSPIGGGGVPKKGKAPLPVQKAATAAPVPSGLDAPAVSATSKAVEAENR